MKVKLIAKVKSVDEGSAVQLDIHLGGPALFGPIGMVVAAALRTDIQQSLYRFRTVFS